MTKDEILAAAKALDVRLTWHSYIDVPAAHCFATWDIPSKSFNGADLIAWMVQYPLRVTFFYREEKQEEDFELEKQFEDAVRNTGEFTAESGYDSDRNLFYTQYEFNLTEEF